MGISTEMQPSLGLVLPVIAAVYLAGLGAWGWQWLKIRSGVDDLVIDASARTLYLPKPTTANKC